MTRPKNIAFILPHALGKLCLVLRLLVTARNMLHEQQHWTVFTQHKTVSAIQSLSIFDEVLSYDQTSDTPFLVLIDLTSYEYSYALSEKLTWKKIIRRQANYPWRIEHQQGLAIQVYDCPALLPQTGWFAINPLASAMLCELPVLNIGLGYMIDDQEIYQKTISQGRLNIFGLAKSSSYDVLVLPNGTHPAKHYPLPFWVNIFQKLQSLGLRITAVIGPDEQSTVIPMLDKHNIQWILPDDVLTLFDVVLNSRLILANDCGPMHVALMLGKPTLAIFGPTIPESWFCSTTASQYYLQTPESISHRSDIIAASSWAAWPSSDEVLMHLQKFFPWISKLILSKSTYLPAVQSSTSIK